MRFDSIILGVKMYSVMIDESNSIKKEKRASVRCGKFNRSSIVQKLERSGLYHFSGICQDRSQVPENGEGRIGRTMRKSIMRKSLKKGTVKPFMLVIDWLHPWPEKCSEHGYSYEFYDSWEEVNARAEMLMKFRESTDWHEPGRAYLVDCMKRVGRVVKDCDGYCSAARYEIVATMRGLDRGWVFRDKVNDEEWESWGSAVADIEAVYRNVDGELLHIGHDCFIYNGIVESKKQKAC